MNYEIQQEVLQETLQAPEFSKREGRGNEEERSKNEKEKLMKNSDMDSAPALLAS